MDWNEAASVSAATLTCAACMPQVEEESKFRTLFSKGPSPYAAAVTSDCSGCLRSNQCQPMLNFASVKVQFLRRPAKLRLRLTSEKLSSQQMSCWRSRCRAVQ
mmetsp:Transcript_56055/g.133536  ORF Transcript_56055/g.133536 Transcript_56055/m.133536 type:complete len:103 (+) Transcript_56055:66-374(+)